MTLALAIPRSPVRDWSRVLSLKDAAAILAVSEETLRLRCQNDLSRRDLAFVDQSPDGGKRQWFIHRSYDPKLQPGVLGDRQREPDMSGFSERQRNNAYARRHCVKKLIELERSHPHISVPARHAQVIAHATARFNDFKISSQSLYRWRAAYRNPCDLIALVDSRGGDRRSMGSVEAWDTFRSLYLSENRPACRAVWKDVRRLAAESGWEWCSYASCSYQLNKRIPPQDQTKFRDPAKYRSALAPYIPMEPESFAPGKLWVGDHKQLDLICMWEGKKIRPWLTAWMDWRTRKIVGWVLSESPNSSTILAAFRAGMLDPANRGGPDEVWIDNGKDYSAWVFHGTTKRQRQQKFEVDEKKGVGIFGGLGITAHFAQKYNGNGKSHLERWFGRLTSFAQHMPTFTGIDVDSKPEGLKDILADEQKIPHFVEIESRLAAFINGFNENAEHDIEALAEDGHSIAPAEAFRRWVTSERRAIDPQALDIFLNQWPREVYVGRNGISIAIRGQKVTYGQFEPMLAPFKAARLADRIPLRVAYDPKDITEIKVFRDDWSFVCSLRMNGIGGRGPVVTAADAGNVHKLKRRYNRAKREAHELSITDITTPEEQIAAVAHQRLTPPQSIRPVQTPLDGQSKAVQREQLRKAVGDGTAHADSDGSSLDRLMNRFQKTNSRTVDKTSSDLLTKFGKKNHEW